MDERRLTVFRTVARELSFTQAALALHLSQSAVSQQIAALEAELGGPLLDRSRRHVRLTPAGAALLGRVDGALAELAEARRAVAAARGTVEGDLRVTASRTVGTYLLPAPLAALARRHPAVAVHVSIENSERTLGAVLSGAADIGYVEDDVSHPGIDAQAVLEDELVVIAAASHRFARLSQIPASELASEPVVMREPGSGTRRVAEASLRLAGIPTEHLRVVAELTGIEAIKAAVEAGLGVSILSSATLGKELMLGTLVARPLAEAEIRRRISAVSAAGASVLPAARELTGLLAGIRRPDRGAGRLRPAFAAPARPEPAGDLHR